MAKTIKASVLSIYDENGNKTAIPAVRGKDAYEYAAEGGYTGTEADFAQRLATDYGAEIDKLSEKIVDKLPKNQGAENVGKILVVGTDGYLTLTDMPEGGASSDVTGVLDESNNILLTGNLADGTYTLKYENEDGTYTEIGILEVGAIPEPEPVKINFADPTSADWVIGGRISNGSANGIAFDVSRAVVTNYIPIQVGDILVFSGCDLNTTAVSNLRYAVYTGTTHSTRVYNGALGDDEYAKKLSSSEVEIVSDAVSYFRHTLVPDTDLNAIVINIKRNGEWL